MKLLFYIIYGCLDSNKICSWSSFKVYYNYIKERDYMRIVGFIGSSGTGKSYRALWVAKERGIDYIIDDGLFIHQNRIIAGKSAKKEPTKIGSIKTALFCDPVHCKQVMEAVEKNKPDAIMILGTSDAMVEKIAETLQLGKINEKV
jgi:ABC-type dipeptide/oligopeptide/nickel transport system ATPase component